MKPKLLVYLLLSWVVCGCAVKIDQQLAPETDRNAVQNFEIKNGFARVVVYSGKIFGIELNRAFEVFVNNTKIGTVGNKNEMVAVDVPAGTYSFKCNVPSNDLDYSNTRAEMLTFSVRENESVYFIANFNNESNSSTGLMFGASGAAMSARFSMSLEQVDQSAGRSAIASRKLVSRYVFPEIATVEKQVGTVAPKQNTSTNNSSDQNDVEAKMAKLKRMHENGLLSKDEYDLKRKELLDKL